MSVKQPEEMAYGEKRAKYLAEIADACKDLAAIVEKSLDENMMPVVPGGDHSIAAETRWSRGAARQVKREKVRAIYLFPPAGPATAQLPPSRAPRPPHPHPPPSPRA